MRTTPNPEPLHNRPFLTPEQWLETGYLDNPAFHDSAQLAVITGPMPEKMYSRKYPERWGQDQINHQILKMNYYKMQAAHGDSEALDQALQARDSLIINLFWLVGANTEKFSRRYAQADEHLLS